MKHNSKLTERAQELRRNMTKEERRLWYEYLSKYSLRFRRQVTFDRYILDFYCAAAKLCVELDGSQHFDENGIVRDRIRTEFLQRNGIMVLRFANNDVMQNLRGVCELIDLTIKHRIEDLSRPV